MLDGSTVLDIFKSVKHTREAYENSSISGGDNDNSPVIECPSHCEALQATATIQRFIAEMDDSFARKLENIWACS